MGLTLLALLLDVEAREPETVAGLRCSVVHVTPRTEAMSLFKLPAFRLKVWVRPSDLLPGRISYTDGKKITVDVEIQQPQLGAPWPAEKWKLPARRGDHVETVVLSHVARFMPVAFTMLGKKAPTLGPALGERRVAAVEGQGRLEKIDGTRVLFLKGPPAALGQQHGKLLKKPVNQVVERLLYGVGVGSSFAKGRWFFGEIEQAQRRLARFTDPRYFQEMDALALAAGCDPQEIRLANFFPELFHCSGFALFGRATQGGRLYHGRILDYLRGVGLEENAVVTVCQPDVGNAWVNVGYAGFIGSVTAMNDKHLAIGEMGGRGEGHWDGKPMAQLVREVMEKASTLDEAVEIAKHYATDESRKFVNGILGAYLRSEEGKQAE